MKSCPYEILGLTKTATNEEIKRAYKKLAFLYHPDKNNHLSEDEHRKCEEEFKKVNNAYRKLTDPNYSPDNDAFFSSSFRGKIPEWMYSLFDKFELSENTFSNVMYDIKNLTEYYRLNTNKKKVAPTLYFHVNCSLEDIYNGVTKELNITVQKKCTKCMGLGKKIIQDSGSLCNKCNGTGFIEIIETLPVYVDRKQMTYEKKGNETLHESRGSVEITILAKPHPVFTIINNYDLLLEISLESLEKNNYTIKHITGEIIDIPKELLYSNESINSKINIENKGLLYPIGYEKERGDLWIWL